MALCGFEKSPTLPLPPRDAFVKKKSIPSFPPSGDLWTLTKDFWKIFWKFFQVLKMFKCAALYYMSWNDKHMLDTDNFIIGVLEKKNENDQV